MAPVKQMDQRVSAVRSTRTRSVRIPLQQREESRSESRSPASDESHCATSVSGFRWLLEPVVEAAPSTACHPRLMSPPTSKELHSRGRSLRETGPNGCSFFHRSIFSADFPDEVADTVEVIVAVNHPHEVIVVAPLDATGDGDLREDLLPRLR